MDEAMIARELLAVAKDLTAAHALDEPFALTDKIEKMLKDLLKSLKRAKGTSDYIDEKLLAEMIREVNKARELIEGVSAGASDISSNIESRRWNFTTKSYGPEWGTR